MDQTCTTSERDVRYSQGRPLSPAFDDPLSAVSAPTAVTRGSFETAFFDETRF